MGDMSYIVLNNKLQSTTDGINSLKQSINTSLIVPTGDFDIYSWKFGNQLLNILTQPREIIKVSAEAYIKECLKYDDRILDVYDFSIDISNDSLCILFTVSTIYGSITQEVDYGI